MVDRVRTVYLLLGEEHSPPTGGLPDERLFLRELGPSPFEQATWLAPRRGHHSCGTAPGSHRTSLHERYPPGIIRVARQACSCRARRACTRRAAHAGCVARAQAWCSSVTGTPRALSSVARASAMRSTTRRRCRRPSTYASVDSARTTRRTRVTRNAPTQ